MMTPEVTQNLTEALKLIIQQNQSRVDAIKALIQQYGFQAVVAHAEKLGNKEAYLATAIRLQRKLEENPEGFKNLLERNREDAQDRLLGVSRLSGPEGPWGHNSSSFMGNLENMIRANAQRDLYQVTRLLLGIMGENPNG